MDGEACFVPRFHTLSLSLTPSTGARPDVLRSALQATTLLFSLDGLNESPVTPVGNKTKKCCGSGHWDNFDASQNSLNPLNARLAREGIQVSRNGQKVYISDEYGPCIDVGNRDTGQRAQVFSLPATFAMRHLSSQGSREISGNTQGPVANTGMAGPATAPDGKTLFGCMQSPLIQGGGDAGRASHHRH